MEREIHIDPGLVAEKLQGLPCDRPGCSGYLCWSYKIGLDRKITHRVACSECHKEIPLEGKESVRLVYGTNGGIIENLKVKLRRLIPKRLQKSSNNDGISTG